MAKYTYTLGRRKTAVATVRLYEGNGENLINDKPLKEYIKLVEDQMTVLEPLKITGTEKAFYFTAKMSGGGYYGQLKAIVHGLSRALAKQDPEYKKILKKALMLRRDDRMVERKKTGLRKARKAPQFSKR